MIGWEPAVYMIYKSQNLRLFHVSNLSVLKFRISHLIYPGPVSSFTATPLSQRRQWPCRMRPSVPRALRSIILLWPRPKHVTPRAPLHSDSGGIDSGGRLRLRVIRIGVESFAVSAPRLSVYRSWKNRQKLCPRRQEVLTSSVANRKTGFNYLSILHVLAWLRDL